MSIHNLIHKIKSRIGIDKMTFLYLLIIMGVGISSFGLGRLSVVNKVYNKADNSVINQTGEVLKTSDRIDGNISTTQVISSEKRYVASKNGKMYYSLGCSGANRIKSENEVWFNTKEQAEKSGYALASACK